MRGVVTGVWVITCSAVFVGCKQQPRPRSLDFSSSNRVFNRAGRAFDRIRHRLAHIYFENDGLTTVTVLDDVHAVISSSIQANSVISISRLIPHSRRFPCVTRASKWILRSQAGHTTLHSMPAKRRPTRTRATRKPHPRCSCMALQPGRSRLFLRRNATFKNAQIPAPTFAVYQSAGTLCAASNRDTGGKLMPAAHADQSIHPIILFVGLCAALTGCDRHPAKSAQPVYRSPIPSAALLEPTTTLVLEEPLDGATSDRHAKTWPL